LKQTLAPVAPYFGLKVETANFPASLHARATGANRSTITEQARAAVAPLTVLLNIVILESGKNESKIGCAVGGLQRAHAIESSCRGKSCTRLWPAPERRGSFETFSSN
jgi:hypothetical protein